MYRLMRRATLVQAQPSPLGADQEDGRYGTDDTGIRWSRWNWD